MYRLEKMSSVHDLPSTVLFPDTRKVGYRHGNTVVIFSVDSLSIEKTLEFPFPVRFFSLPFDEHYILVVDDTTPSVVILWDTSTQTAEKTVDVGKPIQKFLTFGSFSCIVTPTSCVVVRNHPFVIHHTTTTKDTLATVALAMVPDDVNHCVLAIPDEEHPGTVLVHKIPSSLPPVSIPAHKSAISVLALSFDGKFLATASVKGTIVRLWSSSGDLLHESRRGWSGAGIVHMSFSPCAGFMCASSNHMTAHVFKVERSSTGDKWFLPKADVTVGLPASKTFASFVTEGGRELCCVTDVGNCFVYDINVSAVTSKLRSSIMIPKLAELACGKSE